MTEKELYDLTMKLHECSLSMKELSEDASDILLSMASRTLEILEREHISDEVKSEIDGIREEILKDDE